jgi:hypothetical protein
MEWIQNHWQAIVGTIAGLVGLGWLPFTRVIIMKGIKVLLSETFLQALFFDLAEKYVASTKTTLDDKFLKALKKSFN